ncbi:MAG TPA: FAD-dependent oxidoreductase [Thermomicrobiales bacterium]|nr:FAD-dependent oxidoreductase [Thermomicrobiales bacterium]
MNEAQTDILIVGAGLGGVAGALAACRMGRNVILTEETDWIGGQLTSQAVPPDEYWLIESYGPTGSYRRLREGIRDYYRRNYPLLPDAMHDPRLNPGQGNVSRLCHEPRVALAVMHEMLAPYLANGQLQLWLKTFPTAVEMDGDRVRAVTLKDLVHGHETVVTAPYVLDATETGDLLELGDVEHVLGSEAKSDTGELHALDVADPLDQQAVTWTFPMSHHPGEDHTIDKPAQYDFWRDYQADFWPDKQLSWHDVHPITLETRHRAVFETPPAPENAGDKRFRNLAGAANHPEWRANDFWHYRRIVYAGHYPEGFAHDVTLVNWPQHDYWLGPVVGVSEEERQKHLEGARQLSLSLLYWMQTEAPRHDGGTGYPGLKIRPEIVDTPDGLAKAVYIREGRRIKAEFTVREDHVGVEQRRQMGCGDGPAKFDDSVGIGYYRIDLHPSTGLRTYVDISSWPFQIPLGALIPQRVENLLPANKNIGTTHITNGCYRLHPVEWSIGEAAGALAAWSLNGETSPRGVRNDGAQLKAFQDTLVKDFRAELDWPKFVPAD